MFNRKKKSQTPDAEAPAKEEVHIEDLDLDQAAQNDAFIRSLKKEAKRRAAKEEQEAKDMQKAAQEMLKRAEERKKQQQDLEHHQERVRDMAGELGFDPDRPVLEVPPVPEGMEEVERIVITEGFAEIRILYDSHRNEYIYEVLEPALTKTDEEALDFLRDTLVRTMDGRSKREEVGWEEYLDVAVEEAVADHDVLVDRVSLERIQYHLKRDFLGFGPVDVLMKDSLIEDISCDGPGIPLYLFHRKYESIRTTVRFEDDLELDSFVIRLAQQSGKHISIADPLLDATLPDGSRLQATLSKEVTTRGSSFTVRKFRAEPLTPADLIHYGTISAQLGAYLWFMLEQGASLIIAGGTASGKTTTLNAACQFIPPEKKIVSIEDTREINLEHENWIAGVTRGGFGEKVGATGKASGAVDMYDLLAAALRQRPEYLLVGEVRGPEALTLFQAMATGHAVYSTMHADSVPSAVYRLENPPINVPRMMLQTMDVMAIQGQVRINDRMTRRVLQITEFVGFDPETGDLLTNAVFEWNPETDSHVYLGKSHLLEKRMARDNITEDELEVEYADRIAVLEYMVRSDTRSFDQVSKLLHQYYRDKPSLMALVHGRAPTAKTVQDRMVHGGDYTKHPTLTGKSPPSDKVPAAAKEAPKADEGPVKVEIIKEEVLHEADHIRDVKDGEKGSKEMPAPTPPAPQTPAVPSGTDKPDQKDTAAEGPAKPTAGTPKVYAAVKVEKDDASKSKKKAGKEDADDGALCTATTSKGDPCKRKARPGRSTCSLHASPAVAEAD